MFPPSAATTLGVHAASTRRRRWRRAATGLVALAALIGFLTAVPVALWTWRHNPLPSNWEPQRWWMLARAGFVHPDVVPNALTVATWLLWAQVLFALARETAARVHRRVTASRSALVLPGVQEVARGWVTAISLVLTVAASRPESAHALAALPAAASAAAFDSRTADAVADASADSWWEPAVTLAGGRRPPAGADADQHHAGTVYTCDRYETLRSLAARRYGDPAHWTRIRDASVGLRQADGARLPAGFVAVDEGTRLLIPADATGPDMQTADLAPAGSDRATSPGRQLDPAAAKHVVETGDTLWDIAEANYPDAGRADIPRVVRAIYTTNRGVGDGHGRALRDPDLINPGMLLRLPAVRPDHERPAVTPRGAPQQRRPGPSPQDPPPRPEDTPRTPTQAPAQPAPSPRTPSAASPSPSARTDAPTATPGIDIPAPAAPAWVAAATLLATGFAGLWAFRRRRRDSKSRPDRVAPPDDPTLFGLHTALGASEDTEALNRLDVALRHLAAQHVDGSPVPQVILRRTDGELEVFFGSPCGFLPKPWIPRSDLRIWALPADAPLSLDIRPGLADMPAPCPALVQLGATDDEAELYIDLEAIGVLTVATGEQRPDGPGDAAALRGIARAVTATLAVSPLAGIPRVRTTGFDPFGLAAEERVIAEKTIDDLLDHAAADTEYIRRGLRKTGVDTTLALRVLHPNDGSDPTVAVIGRATVSSQHIDRITDLAGGGGRGVAVVGPAGTGLPGPWQLVVDDTPTDESHAARWRLEPVDISFSPLLIAAEELRDLATLLAEAETPLVTVSHEPSSAEFHDDRRDLANHQANGPDQLPAAAPPNAARQLETEQLLNAVEGTPAGEPVLTKAVPDEPDWRVMVRLLGPVDVIDTTGRSAEGARGRTVEVVAWLVTHRRHATRSELDAGVWPKGAQDVTVMNELSRARRLLEQLAGHDARDWIPLHQTDFQVHPHLTSDLEVLQARLSHARRHSAHPEVAIPALYAALSLIRGIPVRYGWLDAEIGSTLRTAPIDVALLLAEHYLAQDDIDKVLEVTAAGLAVLPAHAELFALRMRARAAKGDHRGLREEYDAFRRAELADPMTEGETDRDLEGLYIDLKRAGQRPKR